MVSPLRNPDCQRCELYNGCSNVCVTGRDNPGTVKLMVVSDYPSEEDDQNNTVMATFKDQLFWDVYDQAITGSTRDIIYLTHMVKCRPPAGQKPDSDHLKACMKHLMNEIDHYKPKVVLTLGEMTFNFLTGEESASKNHGKIISLATPKGTPFELIPTFSPVYVRNAEGKLKYFAQDIYKAWCIAEDIQVGQSRTKIIQVMDMAAVKQLFGYVRQVGFACFDFETKGDPDSLHEKAAVRYQDDGFEATLLSISFQHGSAYTIPLHHFESPFTPDQCMEILGMLFGLFYDKGMEMLAHNISFDLHVCMRYGLDLRKVVARLHDSMLIKHLVNEVRPHGLKEIVADMFPEWAGYEDEVRKYKWHLVPLSVLCPYGGVDTDATIRVFTHYLAELIKDERSYVLYRNLTMPIRMALTEAEHGGMDIDEGFLDKAAEHLQELADQMREKLLTYRQVKLYEDYETESVKADLIKKAEAKRDVAKGKNRENWDEKIRNIKAGVLKPYEGINMDSPNQVAKLLYGLVGFRFKKPYVKKKKGEWETTDRKLLKRLGDKTGFIDDLLIYRTMMKLRSTYVLGIKERLGADRKIHSNYLVHGTETGRLSSQDPNLQNLPSISKIKNEMVINAVQMIKKLFSCPEGYYIVPVDFSQAELRLMAEFSGDQNMIEVYRNKQDIHSLTASMMLDITLEAFKELSDYDRKDWRFRAKAVNFGFIYGMEAESFVEYARDQYDLILTLEEGMKFRKAFFKMFPGLADYYDQYIAKAKKFEQVRTLFGRIRHIGPDIHSPDSYLRSMEERVAINSPIQGTAGEMTLLAIILCRLRCDPRVLFRNTVHDSIIFYIPKDIAHEQILIIKETCENLPMLQYFGKELSKVSMVVDVEYGDTNWKEVKEYPL